MIIIFNAFIESLSKVITMLLNLLPESPFTWDMTFDSTIINFLNWLIPIQAMATFMLFFVSAVAVYYGLRIALRWAKAAGG